MRNISEVKITEGIDRLIQAINGAISQHTRQSPMSLEDIVGVLALMTGGGIGHIKDRNERRLYRQMADANIERGIERALRESARSSIIMPEARIQ